MASHLGSNTAGENVKIIMCYSTSAKTGQNVIISSMASHLGGNTAGEIVKIIMCYSTSVKNRSKCDNIKYDIPPWRQHGGRKCENYHVSQETTFVATVTGKNVKISSTGCGGHKVTCNLCKEKLVWFDCCVC